MYGVKSLTGTALGSRNALCFSVCYKRRKCKPSQGLQLARGSRVCWWQLTCEPGNSCTGTGQWHLSGCWWHQPSGPAGSSFCSHVVWLLYFPFWSYLLVFTSLWLSRSVWNSWGHNHLLSHCCGPLQFSHCNSTQGRMEGQTWSPPDPLHPTSSPHPSREIYRAIPLPLD